jgi:hypothetical protein
LKISDIVCREPDFMQAAVAPELGGVGGEGLELPDHVGLIGETMFDGGEGVTAIGLEHGGKGLLEAEDASEPFGRKSKVVLGDALELAGGEAGGACRLVNRTRAAE